MKSDKETVIIYQTWYENAGKLGTERQNKAIIQIVRYGLYGEIPDNSDDLHLDLLLTDWMPLVDAAKEHRKGGAPKGNQNAKGHGAPKGNRNAKKEKQTTKQTTLNVNGNENDNKNVNSNEHEASASDTLEAVGSEPVDGVEYTGEELLRMRGLIT